MSKNLGDQPQPDVSYFISQTTPHVQVKYGYYTFEITPFVSRTQEVLNYGYAHQGSVTKITLVGTLLSEDGIYPQGFSGLQAKKDALITAFASDFQILKVIEDGTEILTFNHCIVESVDFASSGNGIAAEYTINLKCYEKEYFSQNYGVLNPSDKTSYNYNENGTISIEHTVSAKGIFTGGSNKAITNAKNWVEARTNFQMTQSYGDPLPHCITGLANLGQLGLNINLSKITTDNCILVSENKNVNRLEGTYSATNEFILQTGDLWNAPMIDETVSEVSTDIKSGINDDYVTVSVNYKLKGSQSSSASQLRAKASQISPTGALWDIATGVEPNFAKLMYPGGFGTVTEQRFNNQGYLPYLPDSISINDRADANKEIEISCDFVTSPDIIEGNGYTFDPSFDFSKDEITSEVTVTMNGTIKGIGPRSYRNQVISGVHQSFSSMKGEYYRMCNEFYTGIYGTGAWLLNPFPTSHSIKENKFKGTLDISYSFDNKDVPVTGGFPVAQSANFDITVAPSMQKYSAKADSTTRGLYAIYDLKVKTREQVDVSTTLNKYNEVDPLVTPSWGEDHRIHGTIVTGYVKGPIYNRGVHVVDHKQLDKAWNIQGTPFNSVTLSSKHTSKLKRQQGTPFNG